jgi:hypothetical protein
MVENKQSAPKKDELKAVKVVLEELVSQELTFSPTKTSCSRKS